VSLDPFNYLEGLGIRELIVGVGLTMMIVGHILRVSAEMTAGRNFHHQVQYRKSAKHELVVEGIYQISRHPSYLGWYIWAVGTQLMMMSFMSAVFFLITSWYFFNGRIKIEEELLHDFFGEAYVEYSKKVPIRIPFIKGY